MGEKYWLGKDHIIEIWKSELKHQKDMSWWFGATTGLVGGLLVWLISYLLDFYPI